eukprot:TRINITY_DN36073_c0_g1_i2.p1 TRINITY_DN36073_c0_g1~~TRINITY_DN36073_c0_g1_i2.p1  ORF type:complete len:358 (+),score=92.25 TRINITY_DN36073_c0_g1_i2:160-1233(+)
MADHATEATTIFDTSDAAAFGGSLQAAGIATMHLNLIGIGDELGLFRALLEAPKTFDELAAATGTNPRYVKEWCYAMSVSGPVVADDKTPTTFSIPDQLRDAVVPSALLFGTLPFAALPSRDRMVHAFKSGEGIGWGEQDPRIIYTTCNFFKPLYENALVPALPGVIKSKLEEGATLADVGCGRGLSCCVIGSSFPKCTVKGFDYHEASVAAANELSKERGTPNVSFEVASADSFPGEYDLVSFLDCFHDMAVAVDAAKHSCAVLKPGGICYLVEPMGPSKDDPKELQAQPTAGMFSGFSCHVCLPCGMCNHGDGLGAVTASDRYHEIFVSQAGFSSFEQVESDLNGAGFRFFMATK